MDRAWQSCYHDEEDMMAHFYTGQNPNGPGLQFCRRIPALHPMPRTPIAVAYSGHRHRMVVADCNAPRQRDRGVAGHGPAVLLQGVAPAVQSNQGPKHGD